MRTRCAKRISQSAWKNKSIWPELGNGQHENYKLTSIVAPNSLLPRPQEKRIQSSIKEKLNLSTVKTTTQSVTESLGTIESSALQKTNYALKISHLLKAKKGTDMHRLFESLQTAADRPQVLSALQTSLPAEDSKSVQYLLQLTKVPLRQILKTGFAEWGFGIKTKTGVLQGQIDLWGQVENEVYILDYKTGSTGYADKAFQQLAFYGYCLYRMKLIAADIKLHLVVTYPLEQKTLIKSFNSQAEFQQMVPANVSELF